MKAVEQVYPVEAPAPSGLKATLRPYQAQSLAFMLDVEQSDDAQLAGCEDVRGGWLADEMGMGKTCVCAALILASRGQRPAASAANSLLSRSANQTIVYHKIGGFRYRAVGTAADLRRPDELMYAQKKVEVKPARPHLGRKAECKFVDDEQNSLRNPEYDKWTRAPEVTFGCTVVLTTNSLLGQWQDELRKFAPGLRVKWYYGTNKDKDSVIAELRDVDVVLTTHGTALWHGGFARYIRFHRLIIDECHGQQALSGAAHAKAVHGKVQFVWGVTGTPLNRSISDLRKMAALLGQWGDDEDRKRPTSLALSSFAEDNLCAAGERSATRPRAELPAVLKRIMIRHTKSQRIHGRVALALPDADCETVWLEMSGAERKVYDAVQAQSMKRLNDVISDPAKTSANTFHVENILSARRQACSGAGMLPRTMLSGWRDLRPEHAGTITPGGKSRVKLHALLMDLNALRQAEPSLHAVVFTHHADAYEKICKALRANEYVVCGFTGGVPAAERHKTIRSFQESAEASTIKGSKRAKVAAKVFVATMKVGNVGITLTAATRVYLMEPCLDPTMEVQAAGRIHRLCAKKHTLKRVPLLRPFVPRHHPSRTVSALESPASGQTKDVLVKRLCYRNSIDGAINELHKKLKAGAIEIADNALPCTALNILATDV